MTGSDIITRIVIDDQAGSPLREIRGWFGARPQARYAVPHLARLAFSLDEQIEALDGELEFLHWSHGIVSGGGRIDHRARIAGLEATRMAMKRCRERWFSAAVYEQNAEDMGWFGDVFAREGIRRRS